VGKDLKGGRLLRLLSNSAVSDYGVVKAREEGSPGRGGLEPSEEKGLGPGTGAVVDRTRTQQRCSHIRHLELNLAADLNRRRRLTVMVPSVAPSYKSGKKTTGPG